MTNNHGTKRDGSPVTDEVVETLADEAERGYDVAELRRARQGGRPTMGAAPAVGEAVRLKPEPKRELMPRAAQGRPTRPAVARRDLRPKHHAR